MPFSPIPEILADLRAGKMVILTDDEDRENEGDLVLPAQFCTPEAITFMLSVARGYMCLSMTESDCDRLELTPQASVNTSVRGTAFTISVDGHPRHGFTTGVSAKERSRCIQMLIDPRYGVGDFVRPGHINPLRSRDGGVLVRTGQTEGSLDLCRLAGLYPAAAIIEIMRDDGEMARLPDLREIARAHGLKICSVAQIIQHRLERESLVTRLEPARGRALRTPYGVFDALLYESVVDPLPHLVLSMGLGLGPGRDASAVVVGAVGGMAGELAPLAAATPTLVRMHRRHLLGDVFGDLDSSAGVSTGDLLRGSMRMIGSAGRGAIVYLRTQGQAGPPRESAPMDDMESRLQSARVSGMGGEADAPKLLDPASNTVPASLREFGIGGQILRDLGLSRLRLLSNSRKKMPNLEAFGIEIVEQVPILPDSSA